MKALVIYGSTWGNTKRVVQKLPTMLSFAIDITDVKTIADSSCFENYDLLMFFASTAGDEELQIDMEKFLTNKSVSLYSKPYVVCELGNYNGDENFILGAEPILSYLLKYLGGKEFMEPFAMDSLPYKDWDGLTRWCGHLNEKVTEIL